MKRILEILLLGTILLGLTGCAWQIDINQITEKGSGVMDTIEKEVSDDSYKLVVSGFSTIEREQMELVIDSSLEDKIIVTGDDNIIKEADIYVTESTHKIDIRFDGSLNYRESTLKITVGVPIHSLDASSGYDISYIVDGDELELELSGACDAEVTTLQPLREANIRLSGASGCTVSGTAKEAYFHASGASHIKAYELSCTEGTVDVSGASECLVFYTDKVSVNASGASTVLVDGDAEIEESSSGASEVRIR